jgi:hypothetical protein
MEPEMDVMAARIFRREVDSAAPAGLQKLTEPKTHKAIRKQFLLINQFPGDEALRQR